MRKILTIFIIISSFAEIKAQSTLCPSLNSFVGEWRYTNGQDTIRIYLRSLDCNYKIDYKDDIISILWGWHEYKKGNTVIESNYANRFITLPANYDDIIVYSHSISLLMPKCDLQKQKLIGSIYDISQCYEPKDVTIQFNSALNQIVWHQEHGEGYGVFSGCKGMTLPKDFVLSKQ